MERSDKLERRLSSARDLGTVVGTMKSMAAVNINRFGRAADAIDRYVRNVTVAMSALFSHKAPEHDSSEQNGTAGFVVFGSAHGLCGQFNQRIAEYASKRLRDEGPHRVIAMGSRVASALATEGVRIDGVRQISGSTESRTDVSRALIDTIDRWRDEHSLTRAFVLFHQPTSKGQFEGRARLLVPIDPHLMASVSDEEQRSESEQLIDGDHEVLFQRFARLYLFGVLEQAFLDSLASESISRLQAMEAAERNIDEQIESLEGDLNRHRQRAITEELLDIVSGFEALQA